jgi:exonuclease SbcC
VEENEKKLTDLCKDLENNINLKNEFFKQIETIIFELGVEDLKAKQAEIISKENKKEKLEKNIISLRNELESKQEESKHFDERINGINTEIVEYQTAFNETSENITIKRSDIINKAGSDDKLEEKIHELMNNMQEIEDSFKRAETAIKENEAAFAEIKEKVTELSGRVNSLKERLDKEKLSLEEVLREEGFVDLLQVESVMLEKLVIAELKAKIDSYDRSINEIQIKIKDVQNKIDNRILSKEQWDEIQRKKIEVEENLNKTRDLMVTGKDTLKNLETRLVVKNNILVKKQEIDKKIGLIDDLEKLFKGKKFVEYVAINQLKYVAVEACKKLKEITGGMYGIEVDENGKFLIRDYKNGGATRDASTLSGGETFLASLALALALSAQIQLKGTAPLELFFLDEGFGTLDDNLLEIVMDSLEKIHNEKLSVGIISHLDAIKNRIPVKLIITPAQAGMGGSKVKIDRN